MIDPSGLCVPCHPPRLDASDHLADCTIPSWRDWGSSCCYKHNVYDSIVWIHPCWNTEDRFEGKLCPGLARTRETFSLTLLELE